MALCLVLLVLVGRQDTSYVFSDAVRYLVGVSDLENVSLEDAENFRDLLQEPLKINSCNRARLSSCGLFSSYQVETILDYRRRCGSICSAGELAVVDGFDERLAACLSAFLDFEPSETSQRRFCGEVSAFTAMKIASGKWSAQWMGRVKASYGAFSLSFAGKSEWTWPMSLPQSYGCSVSYTPSSACLSSAVAGYFNARFGQGLCIWSGMVMENFSTPSSLMRRPAGITPYVSSSVEDVLRGAAVSFSIRSFCLDVWYDCSGHRLGAHTAWNHSGGQVGLTVWAVPLPRCWIAGMKYTEQWCMSADFQQTIGKFTLYGETTIQSSLLGVRALFGNFDVGLRALYSGKEHSLAVSASWQSSDRRHLLDFGSLLSGFPHGGGQTPSRGIQLKTQASYTCTLENGWSSVTRFSARGRNWSEPCKLDLRQDVRWKAGAWGVSSRVNALYCKSVSCLGYVEGVYGGKFRVWLQTGVFFVDNWDDRIYVYQRDGPQSFNVPAMYGRGYWISFLSSVRLWKHLDLYLRGAWEDYPWARETDTRQRPSLSLKFHLVVTL